MAMVDGMDDEFVLSQLVFEVRKMLIGLPPGSGRQLAGPLNPDNPANRAAGLNFFDDSGAYLLYARLRSAGIICVRIRHEVAGTLPHYSILFAGDRAGVARMIATAEKAARRSQYNPPNFRVTVLDPLME